MPSGHAGSCIVRPPGPIAQGYLNRDRSPIGGKIRGQQPVEGISQPGGTGHHRGSTEKRKSGGVPSPENSADALQSRCPITDIEPDIGKELVAKILQVDARVVDPLALLLDLRSLLNGVTHRLHQIEIPEIVHPREGIQRHDPDGHPAGISQGRDQLFHLILHLRQRVLSPDQHLPPVGDLGFRLKHFDWRQSPNLDHPLVVFVGLNGQAQGLFSNLYVLAGKDQIPVKVLDLIDQLDDLLLEEMFADVLVVAGNSDLAGIGKETEISQERLADGRGQGRPPIGIEKIPQVVVGDALAGVVHSDERPGLEELAHPQVDRMRQAGLGFGPSQERAGQGPGISVRTQRHRKRRIKEPVGYCDLVLGHAGIEAFHHYIQIALEDHLNGLGFGQAHLVTLHQAA